MEKLENSDYKTNIQNIKSSYVIQKVFSFLSVKQILNLIKYNKEFQKLFLIDIEYYKDFYWKKIGICRIIEKNGHGKEYILNTNILKFEGEYVKAERSGKGKEYFLYGNLKFEGEYLNGK